MEPWSNVALPGLQEPSLQLVSHGCATGHGTKNRETAPKARPRASAQATVTHTDQPVSPLQPNLAKHQLAFNDLPGRGAHQASPLRMLILLCCFISSKHVITLPVPALLRLDAVGLIDFPVTPIKSH